MIISSTRSPKLEEFGYLVQVSTDMLNRDAINAAPYYLTRNAQKLEDDVTRMLTIAARGTSFEGTIVKVSGSKFPDIVADKYYGVEVKSSKGENWITLGGSINESTRVEDVGRIFITFGKLTTPVKFISRPYEDCLSEVLVTHYPRYKIDMKLPKGNTIFDKMNTTYDELRTSPNPFGTVIAHYKRQLKAGERLWWMDSGDSNVEMSASMSVKLWRTLPKEDKDSYMLLALALFPEILSESHTKYESFSIWLVSRFGIISTSMRDTFSAGGKETIRTGTREFERVPQVIAKIHKNAKAIRQIITSADAEELAENWQVTAIDDDRIGQWIDTIANSYTMENHNTREVLTAIFNR